MQVKHVDMSLNHEGQLTSHGFVELGSKENIRLVTSAAKSRSLIVPGFDGVRVKPENTAIDKNRRWAFNEADQMIKEDDQRRRSGTLQFDKEKARQPQRHLC